MVYGVEHKDTMQARLGVARAARLGFPARAWCRRNLGVRREIVVR